MTANKSWIHRLGPFNRSLTVENIWRPSLILVFLISFLNNNMAGSVFSRVLSVLKPFSMCRNISPGQYWVNDILVSLKLVGMFECVIREEGKQTHAPAGNSKIKFKSQRTRWPPFDVSKSPKAVIVHQPNGQFWESTCFLVATRLPRLNATVGMMDLGNKCRVSPDIPPKAC